MCCPIFQNLEWKGKVYYLKTVYKQVLFLIGKSLQCHQCTTWNDSACADSFWSDANQTILKTNKFLKDCPKTDENGHQYRQI